MGQIFECMPLFVVAQCCVNLKKKNGRMFGFVVSNALLKSAIKPRDSKTE